MHQIYEICGAVQFNQNEKKYIEKYCKDDIENSKIHSAHLATAHTYYANILNRLGNQNNAYNNYVKAIDNKIELYATNSGKENIKLGR